jgi:hypothetical protein
MAAVNTGRKQRGKPFQPGQSGNPDGRPRGSRNAATLAIEELLDGEAEGLTRKAIDLALGGDIQALRMCLERICPPRKDRPVLFDLPKMTTSKGASRVMAGILEAVADGDITPDEASRVASIVDVYRKTLETSELEARLSALEQAKG